MNTTPSDGPNRMIAIVLADLVRDQVNLVRALYDRGEVDAVPPHVPLIGPRPIVGSVGDLVDAMRLLVGAYQPFVLTLSAPGRYFDGDRHLLQLYAERGAEDARSLADAIVGVLPIDPPEAALRDQGAPPPAITVGRFDSESDCDAAVGELAARQYFVVVQQVALLEQRHDSWSIERTVRLGAIREGGA